MKAEPLKFEISGVVWAVRRDDSPPFKTVVLSREGYTARVSSHDRNPDCVLYMFIDDILKAVGESYPHPYILINSQ